MRKERGITLIALVITIIVLLILAGITISSLLGNNSVVDQAQKAKNGWEDSQQSAINEMKDLANELQNSLKEPLPSDGSYSEAKGVNTPKLGKGMTPITWNGTEWVEPKTEDDWYNYTQESKKWANAKTEDGSMWVWIPRYAYQIEGGWHQSGKDINGADGNNSAGKISIKFLKGTTDASSDGTNNWQNSSGQGNWNVHPAFTYGSNVAGIWVAKFEASQNDAGANSGDYQNYTGGTSGVIKIQPGVNSWRNIIINDIYSKCLNYNSTLNSHQMKNSEWGAVAYLAQSVYGKNSEVWINSSSSFITGSAGNSVSTETDIGTTNDYTSTQGVNASTTGNIYGIYDMSGGSWEYTAAYVNNGDGNLQTYGASLVNGNAKTKDVYTSATTSGANTQSADYETAKAKYGDAVYETSSKSNSINGSWYGDFTYFPYTSDPFFLRGGTRGHGSYAGLFYFNYYDGYANTNLGFRSVLVVL